MPTPKELEEFQKAGPVQFTVDLSSIVRARPPSGPYRVVSGDVLTIKMPVLDPAFQQEFYEAGMVLRRVRDDGKIKLPRWPISKPQARPSTRSSWKLTRGITRAC